MGMPRGVSFTTVAAPLADTTERGDVVCFIGLARPRASAVVAPELAAWLRRWGYWPARGEAPLLGVPVPVSGWEQFDRLFDWQRDFAQDIKGGGYLGAAVRSFFAEGGRQCLVVAEAEPLDVLAGRDARDALLERLIPDTLAQGNGRRQGLQHLRELPMVSFVVFPDLVELVCDPAPPAPEPLVPVDAYAARFSPCAQGQPKRATSSRLHSVSPPMAHEEALKRWQAMVRRAARWLARHRRDVQLLAALPLAEGRERYQPLPALFARGGFATPYAEQEASVASAFIQIAYPWLHMVHGTDLPFAVEPGEGALAGVLARNALMRGSFHSAAALRLRAARALFPRLSREARESPMSDESDETRLSLIDRFSLFGYDLGDLVLLSDVTASADPDYGQAKIGRTLALVLRAARRIGETLVFEPAGEGLWSEVRRRMGVVLEELRQAGALAPGFSVRCDRSTMSQSDLDNGRVVVEVTVRPRAAIENLQLRLRLTEVRPFGAGVGRVA